MTTEQHNKYLALSFFAYAGFQTFWLLLIGLWLVLFFAVLPGNPGQPDSPIEIFGLFFAIAAAMQIVFTLPSVVAGYGLLKRRKWARTAGIIGGVTASMSVPIGTAVCVYAMWFLLTDKGKNFYEADPGDGTSYRFSLPDKEPRAWEFESDPKRSEQVAEPRPVDWR